MKTETFIFNFSCLQCLALLNKITKSKNFRVKVKISWTEHGNKAHIEEVNTEDLMI